MLSANVRRALLPAARAAMRHVLEGISLDDVATNRLPSDVAELLAEPGAWQRRRP